MKRPLQNILSVTAADVASRLLGFVATVYLGRVLGASSFGMVGIGLSVLGYLVLISSPGLHITGTRDVAAGRSDLAGYASTIISLRLTLSAALLLLTALVLFFVLPDPTMGLVIFLFSCSTVPMALSLDWFFQGREQLALVSVGKIVMYVVYLVLLFLLVGSADDVLWAGVAFTLGSLAASALLLVLFRRSHGLMRFAWSPARWKEQLLGSISLGVSTVMGQTVMNLPILLVGALLTVRDAGLFNAAMKLIFFVLMIDRIFYAIFFPAVSRQCAAGGEHCARLVTIATRLLLGVLSPVCVIGVAFGGPLVSLVYGQGYNEAVVPLQILCGYVAVTLLNTVMMAVLIAMHRERDYLIVMTQGTAVLVAACVLLTVAAGISGTSLGLVLGEALMTVLFFLKVRRIVSIQPIQQLLPALGAALVMAVIIRALEGFPAALTGIISIVAFGGLYLLFRGLSTDDLRFLRERFV